MPDLDTVYVSVGGTTSSTHYHTSPDCPAFARVKKVREVDPACYPNRDFCSRCPEVNDG